MSEQQGRPESADPSTSTTTISPVDPPENDADEDLDLDDLSVGTDPPESQGGGSY